MQEVIALDVRIGAVQVQDVVAGRGKDISAGFCPQYHGGQASLRRQP